MKYRVVLAKRIYEEIREQLEGHVEVSPRTMHDDLILYVDDVGRDVIEAKLPDRVNWNARHVQVRR